MCSLAFTISDGYSTFGVYQSCLVYLVSAVRAYNVQLGVCRVYSIRCVVYFVCVGEIGVWVILDIFCVCSITSVPGASFRCLV
jgi:hypothetical protein